MSSDPSQTSAEQTLDILYNLSQLLNTKLDREQLATCVAMIESGVNPEALAVVVRDLRQNPLSGTTKRVPYQTERSGTPAGR